MVVKITSQIRNNKHRRNMKKLHEQKKISVDPAKVIETVPKMIKEDFHYPDPENHQLVSFLKSAVRILGYLAIPYNLWAAVIILVISEGIGIIEELV
jgi:hypothetical protein